MVLPFDALVQPALRPVFSPFAGMIASNDVQAGDLVRAGDVLARFEPRTVLLPPEAQADAGPQARSGGRRPDVVVRAPWAGRVHTLAQPGWWCFPQALTAQANPVAVLTEDRGPYLLETRMTSRLRRRMRLGSMGTARARAWGWTRPLERPSSATEPASPAPLLPEFGARVVGPAAAATRQGRLFPGGDWLLPGGLAKAADGLLTLLPEAGAPTLEAGQLVELFFRVTLPPDAVAVPIEAVRVDPSGPWVEAEQPPARRRVLVAEVDADTAYVTGDLRAGEGLRLPAPGRR